MLTYFLAGQSQVALVEPVSPEVRVSTPDIPEGSRYNMRMRRNTNWACIMDGMAEVIPLPKHMGLNLESAGSRESYAYGFTRVCTCCLRREGWQCGRWDLSRGQGIRGTFFIYCKCGERDGEPEPACGACLSSHLQAMREVTKH